MEPKLKPVAIMRVVNIYDSYYVQTQLRDGTWHSHIKAYVHQTSAYAALGRRYQQLVIA